MFRLFMAAVALGVLAAGYGGVRWYKRAAPLEAGPAPATEITYFCRETKALSRGPRAPTPAVNPKTGRATLVQALYCPRCRKWGPGPPAELREQLMAGPVCPVDRTALLETAPADSPSTNRPK
jgi:hypothetical protein